MINKSTFILGQMWALLKQKIVNREFCKKGQKWQYQDNSFSLPDGVSADATLVSGDFILEISLPGSGERFLMLTKKPALVVDSCGISQ